MCCAADEWNAALKRLDYAKETFQADVGEETRIRLARVSPASKNLNPFHNNGRGSAGV